MKCISKNTSGAWFYGIAILRQLHVKINKIVNYIDPKHTNVVDTEQIMQLTRVHVSCSNNTQCNINKTIIVR